MGWHTKPLVYVIYDEEPEKLKEFFEQFGLSFKEEQHGDGPKHYAAEHAPYGRVLEVYPKKKPSGEFDASMERSFERAAIRAMIERIEADERYRYKPALVDVNAPLALIQTEMKAQVRALKWVLGEGEIGTSAS